MAKINHEEYKVLKSLDYDWEWIARDGKGDGGGNLFAYLEKPFKDCDVGEWNYGRGTHPINAQRFQFIQWKDWEPYNIQELIREYESEKTEVKGSEWLKEETSEILLTSKKDGTNYFYYRDLKEKIYNAIDQLDKPEVLSEEWIESHTSPVDDEGRLYIWKSDLQNAIVPKQELPVIPQFVADWIEFKKKSRIPYENVLQAIDELVNSSTSKAHDWVLKTSENKDTFARAWLDGFTVEEEQKYYVLNSEDETMIRKNDSGVGTSLGLKIKNWLNDESYKLTEQEIKDYDERYWPFRRKVEELEEND